MCSRPMTTSFSKLYLISRTSRASASLSSISSLVSSRFTSDSPSESSSASFTAEVSLCSSLHRFLAEENSGSVCFVEVLEWLTYVISISKSIGSVVFLFFPNQGCRTYKLMARSDLSLILCFKRFSPPSIVPVFPGPNVLPSCPALFGKMQKQMPLRG